jgi:hypothetical protein
VRADIDDSYCAYAENAQNLDPALFVIVSVDETVGSPPCAVTVGQRWAKPFSHSVGVIE